MESSNLAGKKYVILGLGISGRSAAEFLLARGAFVHGIDGNTQLLSTHPEIHSLIEKGLTVQAETEFQNFDSVNFLVISPGVPLNHRLLILAQEMNVKVIGEIELGCQFAKNPIVGITGTNGKTTVTLLVAHVLNHSRKPAHALGNIGKPFTRELLQLPPADTIVLELSSDQIETLYQRSLDSAIILNITPDHLDRYKNLQAYAQAKCNIERCIKSKGHFYMNEKTWEVFGYLCKERIPLLYGYSASSYIYTDLQAVFRNGEKRFNLPDQLGNKKNHEIENFLAAYSMCSDCGVEDKDFLEAWKDFKKPPHRIQFVMEQKGIRYFDDSKGTNIDAVIRAVQFMDGPVILIAGGVDKGSSYHAWIEHFKNKVKSVCAIGRAAAKIEDQLSSYFPVKILSSLEEAVKQAVQWAQKGDTVLLSPGCSSFDMFTDYAHRGREFQRIVQDLCLNQSENYREQREIL